MGFQLAAAAAVDKLFSWLTTAENALEMAEVRAPLVTAKTTATRMATKASMAPYSVMP